MHCLVFEPYYTGHRCEYLSHILPALVELGVKVTLTTTRETIESYEFECQLRDLEGFDIDVIENGPHKSPYPSKIVVSWFRDTIARLKPDHCYVPTGDGIVKWLGLTATLRWQAIPRDLEIEAIFFSDGTELQKTDLKSSVKRSLHRFFINRTTCARVTFLDSFVRDSLCQGNRLNGRAYIGPDPTVPIDSVDRVEARRVLQIPEDSFYIGCAGSINSLKSIDLLLDAFRLAIKQLPNNAKLLLAGKCDDTIRKLLDDEYGDLLEANKIIALDRFLTPEEMTMSIPAMDFVAVTYAQDKSSGIALRAINARRPIISANIGSIAKTIALLDNGIIVDVHDRDAFAAALVEAAQNNSIEPDNPKIREFLNFHSVENFLATYLQRLRQRLGLPSVPVLSWDEVLGSIQTVGKS